MALTISFLSSLLIFTYLGWFTSEMRLVQQSFLCICISVFPSSLSITFELTGPFQPRLVKNIRFQIFQVLQETLGKRRAVWKTEMSGGQVGMDQPTTFLLGSPSSQGPRVAGQASLAWLQTDDSIWCFLQSTCT